MEPYFDLVGFAAVATSDFPGSEVYGLADHGGMPGLDKQLARAGIAWRTLFEGSHEEGAAAVAPLLFSLSEAWADGHRRLLEWVAEHGTYTSSLLLLATPLPIDEVAARLACRLDAMLSEEMNVLLRFFDPRVFEALLGVLDAQRKEAFLGVADGWWYFDRRGALVAQPSRCAACDEHTVPLRLTATQEFALLAASEPDQVAEQLAALVPEPWRKVSLPQRADFLERHIADARRIGLTSTRDLTLYCGIALLEGEDFCATAKWRPLLGAVQRGEMDFSSALAQS
ncbi:uncharacterized protein DUF4123 [Pseudoduganella flava]|nr:DUF4123 domain-containing protein [Pseudoduganella flava]TWI46744.1 uncharacterized protein DUF4123 [Pseudoduganella flava]